MALLRSVRSRMVTMVAVVVLISIGAVGWMSRRGARIEFGQFIQTLETEVVGGEGQSGVREGASKGGEDDVEAAGSLGIILETLGDALQERYRSTGGWDGATGLLAGARATLGGRIAMVVAGGERIVAASDPELALARVAVAADGMVEIRGWERRTGGDAGVIESEMIAFRGPSRPILDRRGAAAATLYILPAPRPESEDRLAVAVQEQDFLGAVDRWIVGAVVIIGVLALVVAAGVASRITRPIEQLTEAARRMGRGELQQRVAVTGDDEVGELAGAFNAMAESLERNEQLRRNMVSDIAHELRTPLTNLRGQLEAVQDGLVEATAEVTASLHEETLLLSRLVDDLQELALAEAGQLRLDIEALDVAAEIERTIASFQLPSGASPRPSPTNVAVAAPVRPQISVSVDDLLPPALGDRQRFRQALRNLLVNAAEHAGGSEQIDVTAYRCDEPAAGFVAITVADHGRGIAPEQLSSLFERFYRTDPSRQRATGGAGLGLAIVKQLVEAQGGRVWVESELGQGSTFGFSLPLKL